MYEQYYENYFAWEYLFIDSQKYVQQHATWEFILARNYWNIAAKLFMKLLQVLFMLTDWWWCQAGLPRKLECIFNHHKDMTYNAVDIIDNDNGSSIIF